MKAKGEEAPPGQARKKQWLVSLFDKVSAAARPATGDHTMTGSMPDGALHLSCVNAIDRLMATIFSRSASYASRCHFPAECRTQLGSMLVLVTSFILRLYISVLPRPTRSGSLRAWFGTAWDRHPDLRSK